MLTLWDLIARPGGGRKRKGPGGRAGPPRAKRPTTRTAGTTTRRPPAPGSAAERYERLTRDMLREHGVRVRKWRSSMSGVAWQVTYRDGSVARLIEAPRPRGPMSAAVFLHEIGHHAIGFHVYRPRCLEEYHAWAWALRAMEARGIIVTDNVRRRMHESLAYAVAKAQRRGLKRLPTELEPFREFPERSPARRRRAG